MHDSRSVAASLQTRRTLRKFLRKQKVKAATGSANLAAWETRRTQYAFAPQYNFVSVCCTITSISARRSPGPQRPRHLYQLGSLTVPRRTSFQPTLVRARPGPKAEEYGGKTNNYGSTLKTTPDREQRRIVSIRRSCAP